MVNRHLPIPWIAIIKLAWIVLFTFSLYMLGWTMVRQHYCSGGLDNHNWRAVR